MDSLTPDQITQRIEQTLERVPVRRDHAALLEEMLEGFRQEDAAVETHTPPVGDDAEGPQPDEAGGADDE